MLQCYFHSWINRRRRSNEILCLSVNGSEVVRVEEIQASVREHVRNHFSKKTEVKLDMTNMNFKVLGQLQND